MSYDAEELLKFAMRERDELSTILEALVHQIDPQVTGPMSDKAVSPDRRKHWLHEARSFLYGDDYAALAP